MSLFEMIMLICFGVSWPFSIYKSYKNKSVKGKSAFFLMLILVGYAAGMIHKVLYSLDWVLILYTLNFLMVFIDIILYLKYNKD